MGLIIVVLITSIILWKSLYTINLIRKYSKENKKKDKWMNIIFMANYAIYFYFLFKAAMGLLKSPMEGPLWLIVLFAILVMMNLSYDLKSCKFRE
ncbi:MAG: hypothetical protein Q4F66_10845 [Clostridium sp.]|nr:hypothetical protein [Clostridium sp.]